MNIDMDSSILCARLMDGDIFSHRPLGLYPTGPKLLDDDHLPASFCDALLAHNASFRYALGQGQVESIHFSIHDLSGDAPSERFFSSWTEMLDLWRRKSDGRAPRAKDPKAHLWTSNTRPEDERGSAPLIISWGITHALSSLMGDAQARRLVERELETGLTTLAAEGWLAIPMGKFSGKDVDHVEPARLLARERLALHMASHNVAEPRKNLGPRL
jgi:hypothetical protein